MRTTQTLVFCSIVALITACAATEPDATDDTADAVAETCGTITAQSMIETDTTTIVTEANFGLNKVFDQIRKTTPTTTADPVTFPTAALPMFQELYDSFADCTSSATVDPEHYGLSCRPPEASVGKLNPFTTTKGALHYSPVALINRFDLAAADGSTCGESRIIFWMQTGLVGRAAIIVEMRTPPVITDGVSSCKPVAEFWASLSGVASASKRASMLESFFFKGLPGMPFAPVSATGVGFDGAGQVRLNSFVNFAQWNLREFKWQKVCTTVSGTTKCAAHFVPQTTKNNPSQLLFAGKNKEAAAFQSWFVSTAVPSLAHATDVTALALPDANVFNTYESVSEPFPNDPTDVQYSADAEASLTKSVQAELTKLRSKLTPADIYERATTQTCGGCHEVSNGASLGGGLTWPSSGGFVQVDEQGNQSPAESGTFIPHRIDVLEDFLGCSGGGGSGGSGTGGSGSSGGGGSGSSGNGGPPPPVPVTIDGHPLDAPN